MQDANGENPKDGLPEQGLPSEVQTPEPSAEPAAEVKLYTEAEVAWLAEAYASKRHSALDKRIKEQERWVNAGTLAGQELEQTRSQTSELQKKLDDSLARIAEGNTEAIDAIALQASLRATQADLARREQTLNWRELESQEMFERANGVYALAAFNEVAGEFNIGVNDLLALQPKSAEEARVLAEKLSQLEKGKKPMVSQPNTGLGTGGVDLHSLSPEDKIRRGLQERKK